MHNDELTIFLFGDLNLTVRHTPRPALSTKAQWLLALLILWRERPISRNRLAETLWPHAKDPRGQLRSALKELRSVLGEAADRLVAQGWKTLTLDLTHASVDVVEFDRAIANGDFAWAVHLYKDD